MRHTPLGNPWPGGVSQGRDGRKWHSAVIVSVAAAGLVAAATPAVAAADSASSAPANRFTQTNLVASNSSFGARLVDKNLTNAWGLAASSSSPLWVSDNNSADATVYSGGIGRSKVTLDLTVPVPGGNPTGQVFNRDSSAFRVGGASGSPAEFIVDSDSIGSHQSPGEIAAWDGGARFVVEDSPAGGPGGRIPAGAVFKGLAQATAKAGPELFAADVHNASVDIFNSHFAPVSAPSAFKDPKIPAGYAPFGIQELGSDIYVTYGKQNKQKTNVVPGAGRGYVDVYSVNGVLLHHLISGGAGSPLNEPWGLAIAPRKFGPFGGDLLVGNLGNGRINAFDPKTGAHLGTLDGTNGHPIVLNGLWGLRVGNASFGGSSALVFSAGPRNYSDGLVGTLTPAG